MITQVYFQTFSNYKFLNHKKTTQHVS